MPTTLSFTRRIALVALAVAAVFSFAVSKFALAQGPGIPQYASATATAKPASLARGAKGSFVITLAIAPGFHVNSDKPKDPSLIATAFVPNPTVGIRFGSPHYPASKTVMSAGTNVSAFTNKVQIIVPFTVSSRVVPGKKSVGGKLTYQGCNSTSCYPPTTNTLTASVVVK